MPLWMQVTANLGMFFVAVIAASFGFFRSHVAQLVPGEHFAEGGQFATLGDDLRAGVTALSDIAKSLDGLLALQQAHAQEEIIERKVQERLAAERGKGRRSHVSEGAT